MATGAAPAARVGIWQTRLSPASTGGTQVTPGPVAPVSSKPAGSRSRTTTSDAVPGPAFVTETRNVAVPPMAAVGVTACLATARSTVLGTRMVAVVVRVSGVGSGVGDVTVAVLTSVAAFAVTVA